MTMVCRQSRLQSARRHQLVYSAPSSQQGISITTNLGVCLIPALCEHLICTVQDIAREWAVVVIYWRLTTVGLKEIHRLELTICYHVWGSSVI